jgi:tetratricopeptide (TPR) repeat protein
VFDGKSSAPIEYTFSLSVDIASLFANCQQLFESGQYDEAKNCCAQIKDSESITNRKNYYLPALKYLGIIELKQKQFAKAITHFEKSLEIESHKADVYFYLGYCYSSLAEYKKALQQFDKVFLYRNTLSGNNGWRTIFDADYGIIQAYYKIWQVEEDLTEKNRYADECLAKSTHFINKYSKAKNDKRFSLVENLEAKYNNVKLYQQNIINY